MKIKLKNDAIFSPCRKLRNALLKVWYSSKDFEMILGINASKVDGNRNDPTIKRCIRFVKLWGIWRSFCNKSICISSYSP